MPKIINHDEERYKLVVASIQYITDYGLFGFTLRNLADAQNVTKGYIQHYYDSKEALILDTIDHLEYLFVDMIESDIDDSFDLCCYGLRQMLPADRRRRGLWRARLELGLLGAESDIIGTALSDWHRREFSAGVKLLKKSRIDNIAPSTMYRLLLAVVYGCALTVNINPRQLTSSVQHEILDKAISDLH